MRIIELKLDEDDIDSGVHAVSLVSYPAIEKDFIYFSKEDFLTRKGIKLPERTKERENKLKNVNGQYKFWRMATRGGQSPLIDTSHEFCKGHAVPPNNVHHIDEIKGWSKKVSNSDTLSKGWILESNFTDNFTGNEKNYNLDQQIYNCRHYLEPVDDIDDIPQSKRYLLSKIDRYEKNIMNFTIENDEKRVISGPVMIPNILIYRQNDDDSDGYYVYFSKKTIEKLKNKYGFKKKITLQHEKEASNTLILLDSWIYPTEKNDNCGIKDLKNGSWCMKYKVISNKMWDLIKSGKVKGFSIESCFTFE